RPLAWTRAHPWVVVGMLALTGLVVRLLMVRGIWVDEAISVRQAHMSLPGMLQDLRRTDNHPPLYFLVLWGTTKVLGYSEPALLYTQYFSILPVAIQQLAFVAVAWRRARRGESVRQLMIGCWILWAALTLALLPLAPFVAQQFAHDQSSGTGFSNVPASAGN